MSDWSAGYMSDIAYTYGYYRELNPLRVKLAFLSAGLVCPEFGNACELGFGQGITTTFHSAASLTNWWGNDFTPSQAGFAQELAAVSGSGAQLTDEAFAQFCTRADLPDFDFIGLHGIWSWISDDNRSTLVDFIRRKLKVGGVLYISYNTLPGWAAFAPMRHLLSQHAEIISASGRGIISRVDDAIDFAQRLMAIKPAFGNANPHVAAKLDKLKDQNRHYVAHEYFNQHWTPMHFATLADWLEPAKVNYACSSGYLDHVEAINLTADQQTFLKEIPDAMFRETVRDFMVNQQFRRDYWVKGARKLSPFELSEQLRAQKVILTSNRDSVSLKVSGALGEANMNENIYNPVLDILADHKPRTLGQLEQLLTGKGVTLSHLLQVMLVLGGAGYVQGVQDDAVTAKLRKRTDKLNEHLMLKARGSSDLHYLVSPLLGGGVSVNRFQQLFLLAMNQGKKQAEELAQFVWQILAAQNQRLLKEGKSLETAEENVAQLTQEAKTFIEGTLPLLKALQVA